MQERDPEERGDGDGDMGRVKGGRSVSRLRGEAELWIGSRLVMNGIAIPEAASTHVQGRIGGNRESPKQLTN